VTTTDHYANITRFTDSGAQDQFYIARPTTEAGWWNWVANNRRMGALMAQATMDTAGVATAEDVPDQALAELAEVLDMLGVTTEEMTDTYVKYNVPAAPRRLDSTRSANNADARDATLPTIRGACVATSNLAKRLAQAAGDDLVVDENVIGVVVSSQLADAQRAAREMTDLERVEAVGYMWYTLGRRLTHIANRLCINTHDVTLHVKLYRERHPELGAQSAVDSKESAA
jgi:hypothetical protein